MVVGSVGARMRKDMEGRIGVGLTMLGSSSSILLLAGSSFLLFDPDSDFFLASNSSTSLVVGGIELSSLPASSTSGKVAAFATDIWVTFERDAAREAAICDGDSSRLVTETGDGTSAPDA